VNIPTFYDYLTRTRRDLWTFLETLPDEVLSRTVLPGERFHCLKDLILHVAAVEDSWIHEDLLRDTPIWETIPNLEGAEDGPVHSDKPLELLLNYWHTVEKSTLEYLSTLTPEELARAVTVDGSRGLKHFTVEGLLWHVMQHEVRHTAQIVVLSRQMGFKPPALDLLYYLPSS
jgi:uncharacterized damage-inducible protein DinB